MGQSAAGTHPGRPGSAFHCSSPIGWFRCPTSHWDWARAWRLLMKAAYIIPAYGIARGITVLSGVRSTHIQGAGPREKFFKEMAPKGQNPQAVRRLYLRFLSFFSLIELRLPPELTWAARLCGIRRGGLDRHSDKLQQRGSSAASWRHHFFLAGGFRIILRKQKIHIHRLAQLIVLCGPSSSISWCVRAIELLQPPELRSRVHVLLQYYSCKVLYLCSERGSRKRKPSHSAGSDFRRVLRAPYWTCTQSDPRDSLSQAPSPRPRGSMP